MTTRPSDRDIRIAATLIVVAGVAACAVAIFSEQLGLGAEVARGIFGWKRLSLLIAGAITLAAGALLLARPQMVSRRTASGRMEVGLRRALLALMVIAVAINVVQFSGIEDGARENYRALHSYDTSDLFEIAISGDDSARRWVAPFHYLGELFPGSTIVVPEGGISSWFSFTSATIAFGKAASVERVPYDPVELVDPADLEEFRIDPAAFVTDEGRAISVVGERVSFYVDGEPSGIFIVLTPEGTPGRYEPMAFVDVSVLDEDEIPPLSPAR